MYLLYYHCHHTLSVCGVHQYATDVVAHEQCNVVFLGFLVVSLLTPLDQHDSVIHIHNDTALLFHVKEDGHTFGGFPSLGTAIAH